MEQGGGGVKFFSDTESVTASREAFSTAQRNSFPTPSKTATSFRVANAKRAARDVPRARRAGANRPALNLAANRTDAC